MSQVGTEKQKNLNSGFTKTVKLYNLSLHVYKMEVLCAVINRLVMSNSLCPVYCCLLGSSLRGILQARILEWIAMVYSRDSSQPRDQICVSCIFCIGRWILNHSLAPLGKPYKDTAKAENDNMNLLITRLDPAYTHQLFSLLSGLQKQIPFIRCAYMILQINLNYYST